jgi:hypothetical protein
MSGIFGSGYAEVVQVNKDALKIVEKMQEEMEEVLAMASQGNATTSTIGTDVGGRKVMTLGLCEPHLDEAAKEAAKPMTTMEGVDTPDNERIVALATVDVTAEAGMVVSRIALNPAEINNKESIAKEDMLYGLQVLASAVVMPLDITNV